MKTHPSIERVKLVVAILLVVADVVVMFMFSVLGFYAEFFVFLLFAVIHIDYVRIVRTELKTKWYLEDMEAMS